MDPKKASANISTVKKKRMMSLDIKHKIIEKHERGVRVTDLARQYDRSTSTICTILKQKELIKAIRPAKGIKIISNLRTSAHEEMEKLLLVWLTKKQLAGDSVTESIICEKARDIYRDLVQQTAGMSTEEASKESFKASRGWFDNFKKRIGIYSIVRQGKTHKRSQRHKDGETSKDSTSSGNAPTLEISGNQDASTPVVGPNSKRVTRRDTTDENQGTKDNTSLKKLSISPNQGLMTIDSEGLHYSGLECEGSLITSESERSLMVSGKHKKELKSVNQRLTLAKDSRHPLHNDSRQEYNLDSTSWELLSATGFKEEQPDFSHMCSSQDLPVEESNLRAANDRLLITKEIQVTDQSDSLQEEFLSTDSNGLIELATVDSQSSGTDTYSGRKRRRNESLDEPEAPLGTDEAFVKTIKDQIEAESCDAFGRFIALQLKQLPIENALNLQMVIHNLIAQERLKVLQKQISMKMRVINTKPSDEPAILIHSSVKESPANKYYKDKSASKELTGVKYTMVNERANNRSSSVKKTSKIEWHNKDSIQENVPRKSNILTYRERLPMTKTNQESSVHSSFAEESLAMTAAVRKQPDTFAEESPGQPDTILEESPVMTASVRKQTDDVYNFENQSLLNISSDKQGSDDDDFNYWDAPSPISVKSEAESISSG